jgi:cell division septal protein FtsQ
VVGALAVLAGLGYLAARETSMFAVRTVEVEGAAEPVVGQIQRALEPLIGTSLAALDAAAVERTVESLATVVTAAVDRDFPHTIRIAVRPEEPVAVVRRADRAWLVSARGRVMTQLEAGERARLPRVWLAPGEKLGLGTYLLPDEGGAAVAALARVPARFPARVDAARGTPDELVLVLGTKTELRLGEASEVRLKLSVAATVLSGLPVAARRELAYLDVSLPTRPVGAPKPQVESTA